MTAHNQEYCFTDDSGNEIFLFTLRNKQGTEVVISNYGALIVSFKSKQADGSLNDIVLGFDKLEDYLAPSYFVEYPYFGAAIGRYGNRIKNGRFSIDGKEYQLPINNANDHLHGGIRGFDRKTWTPIFFDENGPGKLVLEYTSPDGEESYPGALNVQLHFALNDDNELSYRFSATCDRATAINLTHHSYFNLDTDKKAIDHHHIQIAADNILEQDDNFVTTGRLTPVEGTHFDFREKKELGKAWLPGIGYDQSFVVKEDLGDKPAAFAYSTQSRITLSVFTTEPCVHFYTGKWIPALMGKKGVTYGAYSGFCFETQKHPNAINIPHFPNTILRPGEQYITTTIYRVGLVGEK